jgi:hypothetical protein
MSWFVSRGRYEVFFNRDERRSRKPALPPRIQIRGDTRFIAPVDGDFGGTWLAVNEHGVTVAVENGYTDLDDLAHQPSEGFTSRGVLLTGLADCRSSESALRRIEGKDLHRYRSFLLTVFDPDGSGLLARWTSGLLTVDRDLEALVPIVSSSFETDEVRRTRARVYHELMRGSDADPAETHSRYHESHLPCRGPFSTCMHRPEARTVSFSRIQVCDRDVRFHYAPHPPCMGRPSSDPIILARAASRPA